MGKKTATDHSYILDDMHTLNKKIEAERIEREELDDRVELYEQHREKKDRNLWIGFWLLFSMIFILAAMGWFNGWFR